MSLFRAVGPDLDHMDLDMRHVLRLTWLLPAAVLCALPFGACTKGNGGSPAPCTDLAAVQDEVFTPSCTTAGCHSATQPAAGLSLTGSNVAAELIDVPSSLCNDKTRVLPGDPDKSYLYEKIILNPPSCGEHMPRGGDLNPAQKTCVARWIASLSGGAGGAGGVSGTGGGGGCETCGATACVDLATDTTHCGACNIACPPGAACASGACSCGAGLSGCGMACVDTQSDSANCGACAMPCPTGAVCSTAMCTCPTGASVCGTACVEMASDPMNCGKCGNVCSGATPLCSGGACVSSCPAGQTNCSGACVDTQSSISNCGGCGKACPSGASCVSGACVCPTGTTACNGACINTVTDPSNCGACGKVCSSGTTCTSGQCVCPNGGIVCGTSCVDTKTDASNCGTCGHVCVAGETCTSGMCACGSTSVSFSKDVQPIFTASCAIAGCHTGFAPQEGMNLGAGQSYQAIVNVNAKECSDGRKRVLPGDAGNSYIVDKLLGIALCSGTKMPKTGGVSNTQIDTIASWICEGAPNN